MVSGKKSRRKYAFIELIDKHAALEHTMSACAGRSAKEEEERKRERRAYYIGFKKKLTVNCTRSASRSLPSWRTHSFASRPKQKKWRKKSINWRRKNVMEKWDFINLWWWQRRRKQHQSNRVWALSEWRKKTTIRLMYRHEWDTDRFSQFFSFLFRLFSHQNDGWRWRQRHEPQPWMTTTTTVTETSARQSMQYIRNSVQKKRGKTQWNRFVKRRIIYEQYKMNSKCLCECRSRYT